MSPNRKAELQRKLSLAPVPKPPAGLADRIKKEIPKQIYFDAEAERRRFSQQVAFNVRVAAAILLLTGSAYLALHMLTERYKTESSIAVASNTVSADRMKTRNVPAEAPPPAAKANEAVEMDKVAAASPAPVAQIAEAKPKVAPARQEKKDARSIPFDSVEEVKPLTVVAEAPLTTAAAPAVTPAPMPAPQPVAQVQGYTDFVPPPKPAERESRAEARKTAAATDGLSITKSAVAADMKYEAPRSLFAIDLSSSIQHYAAPASPPRKGLRLDADLAPAPFDVTKQIVRISLDTPPRSGGRDATAVPLALDATLEVAFDGDAVVAHRALTGELSSSTESMIVEGVSATALYEIELKPGLSRRTPVATARLHYRATNDGKEKTIETIVRAGDLARSWDRASLRTKSASLAAALASGADRSAVETRARAIGRDDLAEAAKKP